ncbi:MAG: ExbD/TolR family protein [Hylemonella sp.]|jgi:biopolymer transport protein TolR|nr:biopolymer transporter ExbD [Synechococcus sp.]
MNFGRFGRAPGAQPMHEINMTPLIDVMLVLLVIFMLTAPLLTPALRLDLPRADSAQAEQAPQILQVALDASGQAYLNEQPIAMENLRLRLLELGRQAPQAELQLRADTAVPYGQVVSVLDAAQQAGIQRMAFATKH